MININVGPNILVGMLIIAAFLGLYFVRTVKFELARDVDMFYTSLGLMYSSILIIHGWRGNDIVFMPAIHTEIDKINAIVRVARIIVCDRFSFDILKDVLQKNREDIIRPPEIICIENYIVINSINLLKRELGLG